MQAFLRMARPGLEPGTPRFSASRMVCFQVRETPANSELTREAVPALSLWVLGVPGGLWTWRRCHVLFAGDWLAGHRRGMRGVAGRPDVWKVLGYGHPVALATAWQMVSMRYMGGRWHAAATGQRGLRISRGVSARLRGGRPPSARGSRACPDDRPRGCARALPAAALRLRLRCCADPLGGRRRRGL
jgi:hypothetical protein